MTQRSGFFNAIDIQPNGHGIIQGDPVNAKWSIWKTTNYGINWTKINTLNAWNTDASSFNSLYIRGQTIYFCGIGGKIFFSSNSGSNWTQQSVSLSWPIAIWFNNDSVGMVGSGLGKTTNGGVNWTTQSAPGSGTIRGIAGYGENWWYVRRYKTIHRSTNNGLTWSTDSTSQELWDIAISKTGTSLWAVGEFGSIYSNNGTITNVISNSIPLSIFLNQNYPNPFNPSTKIKFNILKNSFVELTVFDSSGRLIKKLLNESLQAGTYESVFDGSGIPSGVYFYTLKTNEFTETKKMILLK